MEILSMSNYEELKNKLLEARKIESNEEREKKVCLILEEMKKYVLIKRKEDIDIEVENKIKEIKKIYLEENQGRSERDFLNYGCYYFAYILKEIFKEKASIYTCTNKEIHCIVKINNNYYDVRGNINNDIDIDDYIESDEESFSLFYDICMINRKKETKELMEKTLRKILEKIS